MPLPEIFLKTQWYAEKMDSTYDVIIAGGGPAGGSAAFHLGQAGARVLVLERQQLPRYKPCGGGVPLAALKDFPFSFEPVIEARPDQVEYAFGKESIQLPITRNAIVMVMRDRFDAYLLEKSGAELRTGVALRTIKALNRGIEIVTSSGEKLSARYVIGADGANSTVARQAGLWQKRGHIPAIEVEVPVSEALLQDYARRPLFLFGAIRWGYVWIFPKADHLSVGVAAFHPKRGELQAVLRREMTRRGIDVNQGARHGHTIPLYTWPRSVASGRILLAGDAAGVVDPLTGEGIRFALRSGRLAAEAVAVDEPQLYPASLFRKIGFSHSFGMPLSAVFYLIPSLCFALGVSNPFATRAFVDLLSDKAGYPQVIFRLFATLPVFAGTEILSALLSALGSSGRGERLRKAVYGL
jgi:geranylgeranyl reductase family protein